jgi:hypothetical protein
MLVHEAKVGMKVVFGKVHGEQTLGEIVKVNPTKAKVRTLENRGNGRGSDVGVVWSVPYSLMSPADDQTPKEDPADAPLPVYMPYGDARIMEAILDCYTRLSPEYLTADGERPMNQVRQLKQSLETRLAHLFKALGRPVGEMSAYNWEDERKKKEAVRTA